MTECRYTRAETVEQVIQSLVDADGEAHIIAGGVALGVLMNERLLDPVWLVDISRIEELQSVERTPDGGVRIGALMTHSEVERSKAVGEAAPLMVEMCREIACGRIKNRGTIGGNICLADPQGDPPVALLALNATVSVAGPEGQREIPIREFFIGLYETALTEGEFLRDIYVPPVPACAGFAYEKFGARKAMDYSSTISAAVQVSLDPSSGVIADIGIGLGGVGVVPVWSAATESLFLGTKPDRDVFSRMRDILFEELEPIGDNLYSEDYKRHVASVILERAITKAYSLSEATGGPK